MEEERKRQGRFFPAPPRVIDFMGSDENSFFLLLFIFKCSGRERERENIVYRYTQGERERASGASAKYHSYRPPPPFVVFIEGGRGERMGDGVHVLCCSCSRREGAVVPVGWIRAERARRYMFLY